MTKQSLLRAMGSTTGFEVDRFHNKLVVSAIDDNSSKTDAITAEHITKYYDSRHIINDVSLRIRSGSFTSFIGPSGCGKSTLLRMLANLETPSSGEIKWWGVDKKIIGSPGRRISMVFQEPTLMPWATVLQNVALPLQLQGVSRNGTEEAVIRALELVRLQNTAALYPRQLSGGMKMRVSIARALVTNPNILVMDEPFGALDEITRNQLNEDVLRLQYELDMTVIFVTHSIQEAVFVSSELVILRGNPGSIAASFTIDKPAELWNLSDEYRISDHYFTMIKEVTQAFKKAY